MFLAIWNWISKHRDVITATTAIVAIVLSAISMFSTSKTAERAQQTVDNQNALYAINWVATAASDLSGWAEVKGEGDKLQRLTSTVAALEHTKSLQTPSSPVATIEPDAARIESIVSLCNVIVGNRDFVKSPNSNGTEQASDSQSGIIADFVVPMIYAKSKSRDPAVSASTLAITAKLLVGIKDEKHKDFRRVLLSRADFQALHPNLTDFKLDQANLILARLQKANFSNATLHYATAIGADFTEAIFTGVQANGSLESPTRFDEANFTSCKSWKNSDFSFCSFVSANFHGAEIAGENDSRVDFRSSNFNSLLQHSENEDSKTSDMKFQNALLTNSTFDSAQLGRCEFSNCDLLDARFSSATYEKLVFKNCEAQHSTLAVSRVSDESILEISDSDFTGSRLWKSDLEKGVTFNNVNLDWALLPAESTLAKELVDGKPEKDIKVADGNLIILVNTEGVFVASVKFSNNSGVSNAAPGAVFAELVSRKADELERLLGITSGEEMVKHITSGDHAKVKELLATEWQIKFPDPAP